MFFSFWCPCGSEVSLFCLEIGGPVVGRELRSWGSPNLPLKREVGSYLEFCKDMVEHS